MNTPGDTPQKQLTIWTMTTGAAGMRSQATGLARAIRAIEPALIEEKTIELKTWASILPGHLNPAPFLSLSPKHPKPRAPWPDILITSGRRSSALSIAIGKASAGQVFRIHIQNPQTPVSRFDVVCSMKHDHLKGDNVIETITALHKMTDAKIIQNAAPFEPIWQQVLPGATTAPVIGVLLGGKNKNSGFDQHRLDALIRLINAAIEERDAYFLITPSRRTEPFVRTTLNQLYRAHPHVWLWDDVGPNPYHAILDRADHLLVTNDSVSMISESLYTAKPVHIFPLSRTRRRIKQFSDFLAAENHIHYADKRLDFSVSPHRTPIDETSKTAQIIMQKLKARTSGG